VHRRAGALPISGWRPLCVPTSAWYIRPRLSGRNRWLALSLPLFVAAFLFKQSAVVAPVAITIWLVLDRRRGTAVFFAALALIGYGAAFLITNHLTGGLY